MTFLGNFKRACCAFLLKIFFVTKKYIFCLIKKIFQKFQFFGARRAKIWQNFAILNPIQVFWARLHARAECVFAENILVTKNYIFCLIKNFFEKFSNFSARRAKQTIDVFYFKAIFHVYKRLHARVECVFVENFFGAIKLCFLSHKKKFFINFKFSRAQSQKFTISS